MTTPSVPSSPELLALDLETTGLKMVEDRIVQIALVRCNAITLEVIGESCLLLNPGRPIPKEATEIHHITDEMVKDAPQFKTVMPTVIELLNQCIAVVGYNVYNFDIPFLVEELYRAGCREVPPIRAIDVGNIFMKANPRNLEAAYRHYTGKQLDNAHNALIDTKATVEVLRGQLTKHADLPRDITGLCDYSKMSDRVDYEGFFALDEQGDYIFTRGKHKGKKCKTETGMLQWVMEKDFTHDTKRWALKILNEITQPQKTLL